MQWLLIDNHIINNSIQFVNQIKLNKKPLKIQLTSVQNQVYIEKNIWYFPVIAPPSIANNFFW